MFRILPDNLRDKIIFLYEKGMSAVEAAQEVGLHEAKVSEIYAELGSPEHTEALLDFMVLKLFRDGTDLEKYEDFTNAKKILVRQRVHPNEAIELAINIALFCQKTGFDPEALVQIFLSYRRIADSDIETYEDLKSKTRKLTDPRNYFEQVERDLQAEYWTLFNKL
jgi:hypothetical protein